MRTLGISGAHSGAGKTVVASLLLGRLPGLGAIKVTRVDHLDILIIDEAIVNESGKDTALLRAAGARRVAWLRCPPARMAVRLAEAMAAMGALNGVLIEGNSPMAHWHPSIQVFIFGRDLRCLKPGALEPLSRAQWVVVNRPSSLNEEETAWVQAQNPRARVFVFDATQPGPEGEAFLDAIQIAWVPRAPLRSPTAQGATSNGAGWG